MAGIERREKKEERNKGRRDGAREERRREGRMYGAREERRREGRRDSERKERRLGRLQDASGTKAALTADPRPFVAGVVPRYPPLSEPLARRFVAAIDHPAVGLQKDRRPQIAVRIPPVTRTRR